MEYVRVNLMLFQQDLNRACVQGLLLLSLQSPKWEPSPSPWCWIRREWKNPSSHWDPGIHLPDQTEKTSNRTSAPHLRSMTIIFMLMCKIFQNLESPHTPSAGVTPRRHRRGFSSAQGIPQGQASTGKGLSWRWAGLQMLLSSQARKGGGFPHYLAKVLLQLQIKAGVSRYLRAHRDLHRDWFSPSSVRSQAPKMCKSVYSWKWVWLQWAREGSSYVRKEKKE